MLDSERLHHVEKLVRRHLREERALIETSVFAVAQCFRGESGVSEEEQRGVLFVAMVCPPQAILCHVRHKEELILFKQTAFVLKNFEPPLVVVR